MLTFGMTKIILAMRDRGTHYHCHVRGDVVRSEYCDQIRRQEPECGYLTAVQPSALTKTCTEAEIMSSKADSPLTPRGTLCDGVFEIIIELLILEIRRPSATPAFSRANY